MEYIEIKTERLTLEPLGMKYFSSVKEYSMNRENTKYMLYLPYDTEEETKDFLVKVENEWKKDKPKYLQFAVIYNGVHIGAVAADLYDDSAEIGWIICEEYQRNGFAYEAAKAMVEYIKNVMDIGHFFANCDSRNIGSYKVMEKLGMKKTVERFNRRNRSESEDSTEYRYDMFI